MKPKEAIKLGEMLNTEEFLSRLGILREEFTQALQTLISIAERVNEKVGSGQLIDGVRHPRNCQCQVCTYDEDNYGGC